MGLQRTPPPQRARPLPPLSQSQSQPSAAAPPRHVLSSPPSSAPHQPAHQPEPEPEEPAPGPADVPIAASSVGEVDKTTLSTMSPGRAYPPRRPGMMRTPPPGSDLAAFGQSASRAEHVDERPIRPAAHVEPAEESMEVDQQPAPARPAPVEAPPSHEDEAEEEVEAAIDAEISTEEAQMDVDNEQGAELRAAGWNDVRGDSTTVESSNAEADAGVEAEAGPPRLAQPPHLNDILPTTPVAPREPPKTPRSRARRPTEPLPSPPSLPSMDGPDYGRRYQLTMETLDRAVKAGAQRWTADHLRGCFPQITKNLSKATENICISASQSMRDKILAAVKDHLDDYKVGTALQAIDAIDAEAREYKRSRSESEAEGSRKAPRPDAWRPNISPQALVAATVLPVYDDSYAKLREEYLELHKYCADKYVSVKRKQDTLKSLENGVADGVVDLQKTIDILDKLPVEDMLIWSESAESKLDTRAPEREAL